MLLAFDTATQAVTVALHDGSRVVAEVDTVDAMRHGELLAPGIARVLESAGVVRQDVTAIAIGVGPGPFTGLRVGLVTARTLGAVWEVPVYGVCTLDVMAVAAVDSGSFSGSSSSAFSGSSGSSSGGFLVATDARRRELYWARYDEAGARLSGPGVARPVDVATSKPVVGRGALLYPSSFPNPVGPEYPSAAVLARVVVEERAELLDPSPLYLRRPDVMEPGKPKRVS